MRKLLVALALVSMFGTTSGFAEKTVHVRPYTKKDGTQVDGYDRRAPTKGTTSTSSSGGAASSEASTAPAIAPVVVPAGLTSAVLMGKSPNAIRALIGTPSLASNGSWYYDTRKGTFSILFVDGRVTATKPGDFDLQVLSEPKLQAVRPVAPQNKPPTGAVAKCGDHLFVFATTGSNTCKDHGGVAEWYIDESERQ